MHGLVDLAEGLGAGHRVSAGRGRRLAREPARLASDPAAARPVRSDQDISPAQAETLPHALRRARDCLAAHTPPSRLTWSELAQRRRHRHPRASTRLPASFRHVDLGHAAGYSSGRSQRKAAWRRRAMRGSSISRSTSALPISSRMAGAYRQNSARRRRRRCGGCEMITAVAKRHRCRHCERREATDFPWSLTSLAPRMTHELTCTKSRSSG